MITHASSHPVTWPNGNAFDMHVHTSHSDGLIRVSDLFVYLKHHNLCVAITDHNTISGVEEAFTHPEAKEMIVPGIEVSAEDGPHVLVYFDRVAELKEYYKTSVVKHRGICPHMAISLKTDKIIKTAQEAGGLVIAAHPYGYPIFTCGILKTLEKGRIDPEVLNELDGLEILCSGLSHELNTRAASYARNHDFCMTGGSDAHTLREVGRAVTISHEPVSVPEFLEKIQKQKVDILGTERTQLDTLRMNIQVMTKYAPHFRAVLPMILKAHTSQRKIRDSPP